MTDAVASTQPVVREIASSDTAAWTGFLNTHPDANLYHTPIWRDTLTEVFGHLPLYLMAEREGKVSGILPLYLVKAPLLGSKLISLPYDIGSGGAVTADLESERSLVERAIAIARERKVNYLELRYGQQRDYLESLGFQKSEPVLISEMDLGEEEQVWLKTEKDHRKAVQKAAKRGIEVREAVTLADFREFERVQLHVFRDFGTPPYGSNYFPTLWRNLQSPGHVKVLLSYVDGACVGGLVLFGWGTNMVSKFAACLPHAVPLRAYAALYWKAIQLGISLGYKRMSWGTSSRDQTGLIEFKERWGAVTRPAVLYSLPINGAIPDISKYYDSTGLERRVWRKLPLPLTQVGGGYFEPVVLLSMQPAVIHVDLDGAAEVYEAHGWRYDAADDPLFTSGLRNALDFFDAVNVRATLFVIGRQLEDPAKRELVMEAQRRGHEIASHTVTHRALTKLSSEEKRREIFDSRAAIGAALGTEPVGFRAPGFHMDAESLALLAEAGYRYDSSIFGRKPHRPVAGRPLMEMTMPDCSPLPFPFHPCFSLILGMSYFRLALRRFVSRQAPLVFLFHLTDFAEPLPETLLQGWGSRFYTLSHLAASYKREQCGRMLDAVRQSFQIVTTQELLESQL